MARLGRVLGCSLLLWSGYSCSAQSLFWGVPMEVFSGPTTPPNLSCADAIPLSGSYAFYCEHCFDSYTAMWYSFDVADMDGAFVSLGFSGHGARVYAANGLDGSCNGTPLYAYTGPDVSELSVTTYAGHLDQGLYYIKVLMEEGSNDQPVLIRFNDGTYPGASTIEVPGPVNDGCEQALHFCSDVFYHMVDFQNGYRDRCGWYEFEIDHEQQVTISVSATNVTVSTPVLMHGPLTDTSDCKVLSCSLGTTVGNFLEGPALIDEVLQPGHYFLSIPVVLAPGTTIGFDVIEGDLIGCDTPCPGCIPGFVPIPGEKYVANAWAQQQGAPADASTFTTPVVQVVFLDGVGNPVPHVDTDGVTTLPSSFAPSGPIIDGWQRIEAEFRMPPTAISFQLVLGASAGTVYYDDVRVFPADGSMKCYVYDPENLRFMAELDERHYATLYEYDGEGKLTRVKKETERGVMTIQETRYNSSKLP